MAHYSVKVTYLDPDMSATRGYAVYNTVNNMITVEEEDDDQQENKKLSKSFKELKKQFKHMLKEYDDIDIHIEKRDSPV